jgi:hypothetical protein
MCTVIVGPKSITDDYTVSTAIYESGFKVSKLISLYTRGADQVACRICGKRNIPIRRITVPWRRGRKSYTNDCNRFIIKCIKADSAQNKQLIHIVDEDPVNHKLIRLACAANIRVFIFYCGIRQKTARALKMEYMNYGVKVFSQWV